jgi:hypothetical protein
MFKDRYCFIPSDELRKTLNYIHPLLQEEVYDELIGTIAVTPPDEREKKLDELLEMIDPNL